MRPMMSDCTSTERVGRIQPFPLTTATRSARVTRSTRIGVASPPPRVAPTTTTATNATPAATPSAIFVPLFMVGSPLDLSFPAVASAGCS